MRRKMYVGISLKENVLPTVSGTNYNYCKMPKRRLVALNRLRSYPDFFNTPASDRADGRSASKNV